MSILTIVIEITGSHAAAVVKIFVHPDVSIQAFGKRVLKTDVGRSLDRVT